MKIIDIFNQEGLKFSIDGSKPQILDNDKFVWLVDEGKISVFLTELMEKNLTGKKKFLFEATQGDLLFGSNPEGLPNKNTFLTSGLSGSGLIRIDINQLRSLLDEESSKEIKILVEKWLETTGNFTKIEEAINGFDFLMDSSFMKKYHSQILQDIVEIWDKEMIDEKDRLKEKLKYDKRQIANALSKLASINKRERAIDFKEASGDFLLDACRLIGQSMNMEIQQPPESGPGSQSNTYLEEIAKASRIRTREVILKDDWYKKDGGPILGYMEKDNRPVALIPESPSKYIIYDPTLGTNSSVDKEIAGKIKYFGFVFYRPFKNKAISIWDLVSFGFNSCWKRDLGMIVFMGILGGILGTAVPVATGIIFNNIIPEGDKSQLLQVAFFLGASALAAMLFQFVRSIATLRMEGKMDGSIQAAVWDRLLSLPVPFFKKYSSGEMAMRAMGISRMRTILSGVTLNTILSGIFSVFTFALLFYYDTNLALTAGLLVFLAILVMGFLGYWQVRYEQKILGISNKISGVLLQLIGGITKFRVAGAESKAFSRWSEEFTEQRRLTFKRETLSNYLTTFNAIFPIFSSMLIFYKLTEGNNPMPPGQFIAFNSAFVTFVFSMVSLSESLIGANILIPLYQGAKPILETLPEYDDNKINPSPLTGAIEVNHLSFRYREDGPLILKDLSFQINEGDYVALVGTSGCGKSTLLRVLLGFEKPESGEIYYNGQDLSKIDIRTVRRQLGVVLQNGQLMIGNMFTNIVGANPYLTIDDAWEAARMAGLDEDIKEMPMGMFTIISEGAGTISGGQKQRLMIARAIIKQPKILFFDEATSALDNRTQSIVSKSLDQLQATRLIIAHRLSTIINCNKIIVMDKGRIVEMGNYEELMKNNKIFAELARRQLE